LAVRAVNNTSAIDGDQSKLSISLAVAPTQTYVRPVTAKQKDGPTPTAESAALVVGQLANIQNLDATRAAQPACARPYRREHAEACRCIPRRPQEFELIELRLAVHCPLRGAMQNRCRSGGAEGLRPRPRSA